jgi:tetratricopeptide (TPR) repeat protein
MTMLSLMLLAASLSDALERGIQLEENHRWEEAAALYEAALPESTEPLRLQFAIAEMCFNQQDYARTRKWLRAVEGSLRDHPGDAGEWARLLNAKAALHLVEGNLSAARRVLAGVAPSAGTLHTMASVEAQTGELAKAERHQKEALAMFREQLGERHDSVMRAWISLSTIQGLRRDWRAAERSIQQALAIRETAEGLANLAAVRRRGQRSEAPTEARHLVDVQTLRHEGNRPAVVVR